MLNYTLTSDIIELAPGQSTEVGLTLINESPIIDRFTLTVESGVNPEATPLDPSWINFSNNGFSLRPGQGSGRGSGDKENQETVQILVRLPSKVLAGTYAGVIIVTAASGSDNSRTIAITLEVTELENQLFDMQPPERISRGGTAVYRLTLTNQGNAPHLYPVYAEDSGSDAGCRYEVIPPEVLLQPDEQAALTLKVKPRQRNWADDNRSYDFVVKLEGYPKEVTGRFVQRCFFPLVHWLTRHWLTVSAGLLVFLALLLAAALLILPGLNSAKAAECGPFSLREVRLVSNDFTTSILVSERGGAEPFRLVGTENADVLPGLFATMAVVSPDGRKLAYVTARNEALDDARIWVKDLETNQPKQFFASVVSGLWPAPLIWSPDGELLAYVQRPKAGDTAATTVAATTVGSPAVAGSPATATATVALNNKAGTVSDKLELWVVKKAGENPAKITDKLETGKFYGDASPVVCWSATSTGADNNNSLLVRSKLSDPTRTDQQLEVGLDGKDKVVTQPPLPFNLNVPNAGAITQGRSALGTLVPGRSPVAAAPRPAAACATAKPYSQNDPRWSERRLNPVNLEDRSRISDFGCAVVASTMLLNAYGVTTDPNDLYDACLAGRGDITSPLTREGWISIGENCSSRKVTGGNRFDFSWDGLDTALNRGPAIVGLLGGQTGTHFVVVTGGNNQIADSYTVTDPWDGSTYKTLSYFLDKGYRLRWLVTYTAQIAACNIAGSQSNLINIDKPVEEGKLYNQKQPVPFSFDVVGGSVLSATVKISGERGNAGVFTNTRTLKSRQLDSFNQEGVYNVEIKAQDARSDSTSIREFSFMIDRTAPSITHTILTAPSSPGKYLGPVKIQLSAKDPLSGVAYIEYRIDRGNLIRYTSDTTNNPLTVSDETLGPRVVEYMAEDGAGNKTEFNTIEFTIDRPESIAPIVRPSTTPGVAAAGTAGAGTAAAVTAAANRPGGVNNPGNPNNPVVAAVPPTPRPTATPTNTVPPTTVRPTATTAPPVLAPTPVPTTAPAPTPTLAPSATVAPTASRAPTLTPQPNQRLVVSPGQVTFDINAAPQTVQISNKGTIGALTWSLQSDAALGLLKFSSTGGSLNPNETVNVTIELTGVNLSGQAQLISFKVASNGGEQAVQVNIARQPLPTASFAPLSSSQLDALVVPVKLQVTNPGKIQADHAVITINGMLYNPSVKPDAGGNWTFSWNTGPFASQPSYTLGGRICADAAETLCNNITNLPGLFLPLSATIDAPGSGSILADIIKIKGTATNRVDHIVLTYIVSGNSVPITITSLKPAANAWITDWSTRLVAPTRSSIVGPSNSGSLIKSAATLKGLICSTPADNNYCKDIVPAITDLNTIMQVKITTTPALTLNTDLPNTVTFNISEPTPNINHISLYANYKDGAGIGPVWLSGYRAQKPPTTGGVLPASFVWDTTGLPPQSNVTLSVYACFNPDESVCLVVGDSPYSGLNIPYTKPYSIIPNTSQVNTIPVNSFSSGVKVTVKDANGYLVSNAPVVYSLNNISYASFPSGTIVNTGTDGTSTSPAFFSSGVEFGPYYITAQVNGVGSGGGNISSQSLYYNLPSNTYLSSSNLNYFQGIGTYSNYFSPGGPNSTASATVNNNYPISLTAYPYTNMNDNITGSVNVYFYAPPDDTGAGINIISRSGPFSVVSSFSKISTHFFVPVRYLADGGPYPNIGIRANCVAGTFKVIAVSDSYVQRTNPVNIYRYPPAIYTLTNLAGVVATKIGANTGVSGQVALVNTAFSKRLRVKVTDDCGNPLNNQTVTFTAPTAGASGTFATGSSISDSNGFATAPLFTANTTAGTYNIVVNVGSATPVNFSMTNLATS